MKYFKFAVDVPNPHNPEDAMVCMDYFETKEKAIQYAREVFGADEKGNICLVSEIPDYEDGDEKPLNPLALYDNGRPENSDIT